MSADGDIVRLALHGDEISARAALARLEADREAAEALARKWLGKKRAAEAQRDALAEALRRIADGTKAPASAGRVIARAALAEAGLEP